MPARVCRALLVCSFPKAAKEESEKSTIGAIWDSVEDTEAFVAANDSMILVVFRGTSEGADWITNLKFMTRRVPQEWGLDGEGCEVHEAST